MVVKGSRGGRRVVKRRRKEGDGPRGGMTGRSGRGFISIIVVFFSEKVGFFVGERGRSFFKGGAVVSGNGALGGERGREGGEKEGLNYHHKINTKSTQKPTFFLRISSEPFSPFIFPPFFIGGE